MTQTQSWIGIDVAKAHLDIYIRPTAALFQVPNTEEGIAELVQRLEPLQPVLVVLEATGGSGWFHLSRGKAMSKELIDLLYLIG